MKQDGAARSKGPWRPSAVLLCGGALVAGLLVVKVFATARVPEPVAQMPTDTAKESPPHEATTLAGTPMGRALDESAASVAAPAASALGAYASDPIDPSLPEDEQARIRAGLAYLDRLRALPGAAPLVDDIVSYLRHAPRGDFSVANLPRGRGGVRRVDANSERYMIKDPEIRKKWRALMHIAAQASTTPP